ncbi:TPA: restriction endonuclease subunit S [Photobacterium damselae]
MVPNGWSEVKLGDVVAHQKGFAFKSENYFHDGKRIIRISDTDRNSIHDRSPVYVSDENSVGLDRYSLSEGDIILSTVGSRPHLLDSMVGKAVQIPAKDDGALLNQNLVKLSPKTKMITNNYLFSMLKKNKFNFFISTLVRGNANQVSITLNELFSYRFLLPTYEEQRKIAQILSTWDRGIATTEKLIDASKQQKKALMQQLLTGKKRLIDPETGKAFEGGWEQVSFGDTAKISSKKYDPSKMESSFPCIELEHLAQESGVILGTVESKQLSSIKNVFHSGDVLFGKLRPYLKKYAHPKFSGVCSTEIWVLKAQKAVISEYLYQFVQTNIFVSEANKSAGSKMPRADWGVVSELILKIPCHQEQQKIASVLIAADKEIELLEAKLAHFKQEKKALMQQLLTGKRRVNIAETKVATEETLEAEVA